MVTSELGRRDRKKLATYRALRSAALRLVAEKGLHQVTVEDIAEEADVSVRTFFNHFPSKEDAIVGFDLERVRQVGEALAARPADEPPLVAMRAVLGELAAPMVERSEEWSLRMAVVRASPSLLPRMLASFASCERAFVEVIAARRVASALGAKAHVVLDIDLRAFGGSALTSDLVSVFRSAVERAGLRLNVECPPLGEPIYVDRDMWEKIVLNLLSNAFKFTLEGSIRVRLTREYDHIRLDVADTGVGIAPEHLPRVFERFHRIDGTAGRTIEETGIGLALVHQLVRLQRGSIHVESAPDHDLVS